MTKDNSLCYCNNIYALFNALNYSFVAEEWRLFIDGSTESLKAVLLHNANKLPSVPVAYSFPLKEDHNFMAEISNCLQWYQSSW
jgi:hypothetical protein